MNESDQAATVAAQDAARIFDSEPNTMPVGQGEHTVEPDDCMSSIAEAHGFFWETLWHLPENAELKRARLEPNLLLAGDRVTIPPLREGVKEGATGQRHRFRRRGTPARLRIRFEDEGQPRAGDPYVVKIDGHSSSGRLDPDGLLDVTIPPTAQSAEIRIDNDEPITIALGSMDPVNTWSGIQLRLNNLGFSAGALTGQPNAATRAALARFQNAKGLEATAKADPATRDALAQAHGV